MKKQKEWKVINWDLTEETNFENSLLIGKIRNEIESYIDAE